MVRTLFVTGSLTSFLLLFIASTAQKPESPIVRQQDSQTDQEQDELPQKNQNQDEEERILIPADGENAVARRDFMRTKLMYTKNIFEGLTLGDFEAVEQGINEVKMITEGEQWIAIDNAEYRKLTAEFRTSADRLLRAAKTKNSDATALRFYEMSTRCIDCHKRLDHAKYQL